MVKAFIKIEMIMIIISIIMQIFNEKSPFVT